MTIIVRLAEPQSNQVALWERHPDHPEGEVFLAGDGQFTVAATPAVEARLRNGSLVLVEPAVASAPGEAEAAGETEPAELKKAAPRNKRGGL